MWIPPGEKDFLLYQVEARMNSFFKSVSHTNMCEMLSKHASHLGSTN